MTAPPLTQSLLKAMLHYDPETGEFWWRPRPPDLFKTQRACSSWNARYANKQAGYRWSPDGKVQYRAIRLFDWPFLAHRLAWLYMTGEWPTEVVDHWDRDGLNNTWENLRDATRPQNSANSGATVRNKTGMRGVSSVGNSGRFRANIKIFGRQTHLGHFDTAEAAAASYRCVARILYGEFAS